MLESSDFISYSYPILFSKLWLIGWLQGARCCWLILYFIFILNSFLRIMIIFLPNSFLKIKINWLNIAGGAMLLALLVQTSPSPFWRGRHNKHCVFLFFLVFSCFFFLFFFFFFFFFFGGGGEFDQLKCWSYYPFLLETMDGRVQKSLFQY